MHACDFPAQSGPLYTAQAVTPTASPTRFPDDCLVWWIQKLDPAVASGAHRQGAFQRKQKVLAPSPRLLRFHVRDSTADGHRSEELRQLLVHGSQKCRAIIFDVHDSLQGGMSPEEISRVGKFHHQFPKAHCPRAYAS